MARKPTPAPTLTMEPIAVNTTTAAKLLAISEDRLYRWANIEGFPVIHAGNRLLFPVEGLRQWVKAHTGENIDL